MNESDGGAFREPGETAYQGPVVVTRLEIGGRAISVVRPGDPDRLLDDPAVLDWNRRDDYMPYWAYLWPGAYLLADAVIREPWPDRARMVGPFDALEIGCGLGLAGLAALSKGRSVLFTDYDAAPLDFVAQQRRDERVRPHAIRRAALDWRHLSDEKYPVILGADVIYEAVLVPLVANLLARLLAPGGVGLIATPYRVAAEAFPAAVAAHGLACDRRVAQAKVDDNRVLDGTVYRVTRGVASGAPDLIEAIR